MTSEDTPSATSLQEPDCGLLVPDLPDGPTIAASGPAPVRAKGKASRESVSEPMIQGICGRTFIASSVPSGPLSSWESRLRQRLALIGSTESALIWRSKTTPQGRLISRLAPSTRHTNGTDFIGQRWTTVSARDWKDTAGMSLEPRKDGASRVDLLPRQMISYSATPRASDGEKGGPNMSFGAGGTPLPAQMYSYNPTPTVADVTGGRKSRSGARNNEPLLNGLLAAYSPTPDASCGGADPASRKTGKSVQTQMVAMARGGQTPNGSSAPSTAKRGAPNPAFPFWLMGWSDELISGVYAGIAFFRSSSRKSSRRSSKPKG